MNFIKKLFTKKQNILIHNEDYITPEELNKKSKQIFEPIPELDVPNTDKKIILLMDDDFSSTEYIKQDLVFLFNLSEKLNSNKFVELNYAERSFLDSATPLQKKMITSISYDNYHIITARGNMAAFTIIEAIKAKKLKRVDIAILDIILGGFKIIHDHNIIYDGLDVANLLWKTYDYSKILFYTGCTIGKYSDESRKFREIFPDRGDISNYIVYKDLNINFRRFQFLDLICKTEGCCE